VGSQRDIHPVGSLRNAIVKIISHIQVVGILVAVGISGACDSQKAAKGIAVQPDEPPNIQEVRALAERAANAEKKGRIDEAISLWQQSIEEFPEFSASWNNLGVLLSSRGQNLEAVSAFQRASDLAPFDPRPVFNIGAVWEQAGYFDDAARYYSKSLDVDPGYLPALKRSVRLDRIRGIRTEATNERLRRAMMLETEPKGREWLYRQEILMNNPGAGIDTHDRTGSGDRALDAPMQTLPTEPVTPRQ
jgi:tetratricopeptide (TPR) repeat protein